VGPLKAQFLSRHVRAGSADRHSERQWCFCSAPSVFPPPSQEYRAAGSHMFPGQGHMGRAVAIRLANKKARLAPTFTHDFTDVTNDSEGSIAWTPSL
jgi:hypothetical protein